MRFYMSMRTIFFVLVLALLIFSYFSLREYSTDYYTKNSLHNGLVKESINIINRINMKYILQWSPPTNIPFIYMGVGQDGFIIRNCKFTNCFVTSDRTLFDDMTEFDLIAFYGPELVQIKERDLPTKRSTHQKYIFVSMESPDYYPICYSGLDNFFNWTWTYKVTSDARWGYIAVRDSNNKVIGPNIEMHWMKKEEMTPVSEEFKEKLKTKTKAAAWFVSTCQAKSNRERFVNKLNEKLNKYELSVDIYGGCGPLKCPIDKQYECTKMIETDYYFYLSFENSFAEDYVTETLLHPLQNNAIPIVYGGANYTRFMPDYIYLNARELGPKKLAAKMNELILNPDLYADYFRWKKYYSFHDRSESIETDDYCQFCSMLNDEELVKKVTTYPNFGQWWNNPYRC